mmetsp:Transcript_12143/g.14122  ORF Transcript_12143/g.14122 Transcript_12143/m.14122 type:complete len:335 (+) Transcript_12143:845-1849(+)
MGIQDRPYAWFRNDFLDKTSTSKIKYWKTGKYNMPQGESIISKEGEGFKDWDSTAYNMIVARETKRFIRIHKQKKKPNDPFFAYVALGGVHIPHSPPRQYTDGSPVAGEYPTPHMDVLGEMDKVVGSLVKYLKRRGLLHNTIVIFTSDNGGLGAKAGSEAVAGHASNGPLRGHKGLVYEGGQRVPLMMQWKGHIPRGETRSHMVGLNDLFSTFSDFAGVQVPTGQAIDSVSFADYIFDGSNTNGLRKYLANWRISGSRLRSQTIRKKNMKLIQFYQENNKMELYDLDTDLSESSNIIASANTTFLDEMLTELNSKSPCGDGESSPDPVCRRDVF